MAGEAALDIGQLSAEQQQVLQQYTDVTGQEVTDAIPLLERSQWNVQIAIAKFFDGEGPDLVAEAQAAQNQVPRVAGRHETLHETVWSDIAHQHGLHRANRTPPAPRVVPPRPATYQAPSLISLFLSPFRVVLRVFASLFRLVLYTLSFIPQSLRPRALTSSLRKSRRSLLPKEAAGRFRREFEESYGTHDLTFFDGGHAQALDTAKKDLKFLLTILISPEHDDTESFIKETLFDPEVVAFINDPANNIIVWGGNVLDSEAYQVSVEYMCTKFPFSCLVCLTPKEGSTRMGIVKRIAGPVTSSVFIAGLRAAIEKYAPDLQSVRDERAAQDMARNLRSEQDSAYERSLAIDRERARQRREAAAAAAEAERRAREEAEAAERREKLRQQWRRWRATTIAPEPDASMKDAVRLALNMSQSSGRGRVTRKFPADASLEDVYAFVECYDLLYPESEDEKAETEESTEKPKDYEHKYAFRIASVMPREVFEPTVSVTIAQKMGRGGNLIVEDLVDEEEEE
ncbi:hypothetical protein B0T20DRAFT_262568 [Sordaria brevicollis]|uniref:UAS domain-containing protein n=1 Tax=Sordaria brevicollis TaxID=83679 RepID=A0AAE0PA71_SORBR|nr:hypothetical protein B0T20DRAFT_262568 [Sordaria brevicollis]